MNVGNYALRNSKVVSCPDMIKSIATYRGLVEWSKRASGGFCELLEESVQENADMCAALVQTELGEEARRLSVRCALVNYDYDSSDISSEPADYDILFTGKMAASIIRGYTRILADWDSGALLWMPDTDTSILRQTFCDLVIDRRLTARIHLNVQGLGLGSNEWSKASIFCYCSVETNIQALNNFRSIVGCAAMYADTEHVMQLAKQEGVELSRTEDHVFSRTFRERVAGLALKIRERDLAKQVAALVLPLTPSGFELLCDAFEFTEAQRNTLRSWWQARQAQRTDEQPALSPALEWVTYAHVTPDNPYQEWEREIVTVGESSEILSAHSILEPFEEQRESDHPEKTSAIVDDVELGRLIEELRVCCHRIDEESDQWRELSSMSDELYAALGLS